MIYEDFNGAVPGFYEKFVQRLPKRSELLDLFLAQFDSLPPSAKVVEIGMGSGSLACKILDRYPHISRYVGIEPAEAMVAALPASLVADPRFIALNQGFEDWEGGGQSVDVVFQTYVLHDFPGQLESWYVKIASVLKPGGLFIALDVAIAQNPLETQSNLNKVIHLAESVHVENEEEAGAQLQFVNHLRSEIRRYRPVCEHLEMFSRAGLEQELLLQDGNNYVLRVRKP